MSGLAVPLVYSPNVSNPVVGSNSEMVNAELIKVVTINDIPQTQNSNSTPRYQIVITMLASENQPTTVIWKYTDSAQRDSDYNDLLAAVAASI